MTQSVLEMKKAHKLLNRMDYDLKKVEKGYTNRTLYVNLSDNTIKSKPVTDMMKENLLGQRVWPMVSLECSVE